MIVRDPRHQLGLKVVAQGQDAKTLDGAEEIPNELAEGD